MTLRSRAEFERSWAAFAGAMSEPTCGPDDLLEAVYAWDPPSDEELVSSQEGDALVLLAEARGVTPPPLPAWVASLAGISEAARWCLAALVELDAVVVAGPIDLVRERFGQRHLAIEADLVDALGELRRFGLIRGSSSGVVVTRRAA